MEDHLFVRSVVPSEALVVDRVLQPEECAWWIDSSEERGFHRVAQAPDAPDDFFAHQRAIIESTKLATTLWERIANVIPTDWIPGWIPVCLNERFQIFKSGTGHKVMPHIDGCFRRSSGERSFVTVKIYLNDKCTGGYTRFLHGIFRDNVDVAPKAGAMLVHKHHLLHEETKVVEGVKYLLRSDVLFRMAEDVE